VNYLQLCQRVIEECGVAADGAEAATVLPSIVGVTGELKRIVNYVAQAWTQLQGTKKWNWMWEQPTLAMLATTSTLAGTIPESRYEADSLYIPVAGQEGQWPQFMPWFKFRKVFPFRPPGATFNVWSVAPNGSIYTDQAPTVDTPFTVERYKLPSVLANDTDTPEMPADLHMLIVYMAMVMYANFDEAGVQRATAIDQIRDLRAALNSRCLPNLMLGGPLGDEDM